MMEKYTLNLSKLEIRIYFASWIGGVFYGVYQLYLASSYFDRYGSSYKLFEPGWTWIGRKIDTADREWSICIPFMYQLIPWMITHFFVSQFLKYRKISSTIICCWYIVITTTFLLHFIGVVGMLLMLTLPTISSLLTSWQSKKVAYIVHFLILAVIHMTSILSIVFRDWLEINSKNFYILIISISWILMKSFSCTIDNINDCKHENTVGFLNNFILTTAYFFYFPNLFFGPFILYSEFIKGINKPYQKWSVKRSILVSINLLRFIFWIFFTEFCLHFVYVNVFQYHSDEVMKLNSWAFYVFGYCMGQYFHNKYVVFYGILGEVSRADDIDAPPPPKCIGRIHLCSDMWKSFDQGMYQFLVKYLYLPISNLNIPMSKLFASFITFCFVFIWHGARKDMFIWSLLNFLLLTAERLIKSIGNFQSYKVWQKKYLSPANERRFHCVLATPLLALSAISNFYFFAGTTIANIFFYKLFHDSVQSVFILAFLLYCCCQISTEVKNYEQQRALEKKCEEHSKNI